MPRVGSKGAGSGAAKSWAQDGVQPALPASDAIDRKYLSRFTFGNAALEQEVLQLFADQAPIYLEQLRSAESGKAWADAAHTIKGSAAAIGARRLASVAEMAQQLDIDSAAVHSQDARGQAVDAVAAALEEVCRAIAQLGPQV